MRFASAALVVGVLLAGATAAAQTPKHNCGFCHNLHGGSYAQLRDYATSEDLCLSCHGFGGPAQVDRDGILVPVPKGQVTHNGAKHTQPTSCWGCHNHEGEAGTNLSLIQATMPTPNSGARAVAFTARTGAHSFADGDATYDGVCEVCHTLTAQHRNDGSAGKHNAAADCVTCHKHTTGFAGGGPCTACHNTAQDNGDGIPAGGRRAVVGEFARRSHHVQIALPPDSIPNGDCETCHEQGQHQQGSVRLKNVDGGATVVLTGDPATNATEAAKLTPVCLACHDANGAGGRSRPFSDSVGVPAIDGARWAASSHGNTTVIAGCYGDGASGCHATGHGSAKRRLLAPPTVAPTPPDNTEEEEGFCFACHDGSPANTNIQGQFQKGTNTTTQSFHHPVADGQQFTGRAVECADCHNPHQATAANKVRGTTGIDLRGSPVGPGTSNARDALEYEVCLRCHGDTYIANRDINGDGYADASNKRRDFNDSASAYHPVQQAGRNASGALQAQLLGGLTASSTVTCSDCHNNEQTSNAQGPASNSVTSPKGPHGSTIYPILRATSNLAAIQGAGGAQPAQFALCWLCHNQNGLIGAQNFGSGARTNYYGGSKDNLHWFHVANFGGVTCRSCHYNTHGNQSAGNTIYRIIDGGTTDYTGPPVGYKTRNVSFSPAIQPGGFAKPVFQINVSTRYRSCDLTCHGTRHTLNNADFTYNPQARHGVAGQDDDPLKYVP